MTPNGFFENIRKNRTKTEKNITIQFYILEIS